MKEAFLMRVPGRTRRILLPVIVCTLARFLALSSFVGGFRAR